MKNTLRLISLFYLVLISILLLIPLDSHYITQIVEEKNQPGNNISSLIHLIIFSILYFLIYFSFSNKNYTFYFCLTYSILIETLQLLTSRGFQFTDIFFNIFGVIIAYICLRYRYKLI